MQPPRILILNDRTAPLISRLSERAPDAIVRSCESYAQVADMVAEFRPDIAYSVTFAGRAGYPRDAMIGPEGPKWLSVGGSGIDHLGTWDTERMTVTNSAGVAAGMMAEYAMGAALHFTLDVPGLQADRDAHHWRGGRMVVPLAGKTCLIVGLGHTGQEVAARARAFGMKVIGTRRSPREMDNVDEVHPDSALTDLWPMGDLIVVCVPLLPTTRKLVDARAFAAMKPSAILVDVSRGGVIDGATLINAMRNHAIAGAALDVFEVEPLPEDSPVWDLDNVLISPHCSSVYDGWDMRSFELFCDNLDRWRKGEPLWNVVSPVRGY